MKRCSTDNGKAEHSEVVTNSEDDDSHNSLSDGAIQVSQRQENWRKRRRRERSSSLSWRVRGKRHRRHSKTRLRGGEGDIPYLLIKLSKSRTVFEKLC